MRNENSSTRIGILPGKAPAHGPPRIFPRPKPAREFIGRVPKSSQHIHLLHDRLQQAVREAVGRIGLEGFITPHVLRHGYATHSRESIEALRQIMGHYSIETTAGYRHPLLEMASKPT